MPARILVVEDDVSLGENLCEILGLFGYVPVLVRSAEEALDNAAGTSVDLVLADLRLPRMNGADLLVRLRSQARALPAVLMSDWTTHDPDLDDCELRGQGELEFHAKPLRIAELLASIARLLDGAGACQPPAPRAGADLRDG